MRHCNDGWLVFLGGILLGAAPVCFLGLTPLPSLLHLPSFPGGARSALVCGSVCLIGALLCFLLSKQQKPGGTHLERAEEEVATAERQTVLKSILERYADLIQPEELEHLPWWFLRIIHAHSLAGREGTVRCLLEEWRLTPAKEQSQAKTLDLYACHICGLADLPSLLFICTHCSQFAHGHCSALVRRAYADGSTLAVDPQLRPFCHVCLDMLQTQGWQLAQDGERLLLIRHTSSPNDG